VSQSIRQGGVDHETKLEMFKSVREVAKILCEGNATRLSFPVKEAEKVQHCHWRSRAESEYCHNSLSEEFLIALDKKIPTSIIVFGP